jgi:hypothetical protein
MAVEHIRGHKNYVLEIDAVMTLEAVERLLFRDLPREPSQGSKAHSGTAASSFRTANEASTLNKRPLR